jgi:predicted glycosyltransferase
MKRALIYSHDTYGLGNIRMILSISSYLLKAIPDLSILLVTGSPMIQSFRMPKRLDYVKLPCLSRIQREEYSVKYLDSGILDIMRLRSDLIRSAVLSFRPDIMLVDKKPYGIKDELKETLDLVTAALPRTRRILILRDILDAPARTAKVWRENGYHEAVESQYDLVLILGTAEIFDARIEYEFPISVSEKVEYCGYLPPVAVLMDRGEIRRALQVESDERFVLVTVGGGEDGHSLLQSYSAVLQRLPADARIYSLIVTGPEMSEAQRDLIEQCAFRYPRVRVMEFTNDLMSYMNASDLVVSMGGYGTVSEILSLKKRAIIVPRVRPVQEQWIRAERMARLGLFTAIHPDLLTPQKFLESILAELGSDQVDRPSLDLTALPTLTGYVSMMLSRENDPAQPRHIFQ